MIEPFYNFQKVLEAVYPQIDSLVTTLYPSAKKNASSYRLGDLSGEKGDSLSISTRANNAGCYTDHANPEVRGNAIALVANARNLSYEEAGRWLANFLSVPPEERLHIPKKRPVPKIDKNEFQKLNVKSIDYALSRGITKETLDMFRCASTDTHIVMPHFDDEGRTVMLKYWSCDGQKNIFTSRDPIPVLFGKHLVDPVKSGGTLIITEGQWDAMTWRQLGYPAVSIPSGVSNDEWISEDWNFLNRFSDIFLDFDEDQPGREAEAKAKIRLGYERCKSIKYRYKDANDAIRNDGELVLHEAFQHAREAPIERVVRAEDIRQQVRDTLNRTSLQRGVPFFLPKLPFEFRPHECTLWFGITSHGKALALDTDIPTPLGLRKMGDIKPGDWVFGSDGNPIRVIAESQIWINRPCYEVKFDSGETVVCDENHLWTTDTHLSRISTRNALKRLRIKPNYNQEHKRNVATPKTTAYIAANLREGPKYQNRLSHSIPLASPLQYPHQKLPVPAYTLGAWIGDGTSACAYITSHDDDVEIRENIKMDGFGVLKRKPKYLYLIKGLQALLTKNNLCDNKHIPEIYFRSSTEQRMSLLQGLMDTDGTVNNNQCELCTVKENLANDYMRLILGLGIKATLVEGMATISGRVIGKKYRIMFTTDVTVFRLSRKAEKLCSRKSKKSVSARTIVAIERVNSVPTKCIQVDANNSLFLCTASGIPTHNSTILSNQISFSASRGEMCMVASFEQKTSKTMADMLIQYTSNPDIGQTSAFDTAYDDLSSRVLFFDSMTRCDPDELIATMTIAHKQLGVCTFVVDNVMTLNVDRQDNTAQADVADKFRVFVSRYPVHVHLVAHPRKPPEQATKPPSVSEIRGASEWGDMPHNVITIFRDVIKAEKIAQMNDDGVPQIEILAYEESIPDGKVLVRKQRDTGDLPMCSYRFDKRIKRAWKDPEDGCPYWYPPEPDVPIQDPADTVSSDC